MKHRFRQSLPRSERGAAMLAALCLAMVFAISLSSYIALCYTSLAMSTRNVVNDHCLELAEAGIEQALYASNGNAQGISSATTGWTSTPGSLVTTVTTTMTMTSSGLSPSSGNPTALNYGNGATGQTNITFTYLNGQPMAIQTITSQGVMTLPTGTIISGATPTISRTLTYTGPSTSSTAAAPLFVNAVAATTGRVRFTAAATLDSYNSNPPVTSLVGGLNYEIAAVGTTDWTQIGATSNTQGLVFTASGPGTGSGTAYANYSAAVAGYSAVVASQDVGSMSATVRLNDAVVHGYAAGYDYNSPSTDNWLSYAGGGKLVGPNTPSTTFIDSSRILTSQVPYQPVFPENLPNGSGNLPVACTTGGNILNRTSSIGNPLLPTPLVYYAAGINVGNGVTVSITGPVVLIVYGPGFGSAVNIAGTGNIQLTTPQASLTIFANGGNVVIGGQGITNMNAFPLPKSVAILSTTSTGYTVTMSETQPFYGVVYFPYQSITVSSNSSIYGSIVGSTINISGSPAIHYDNALRTPDTLSSSAAFAYVTAPITVSGLLASVP